MEPKSPIYRSMVVETDVSRAYSLTWSGEAGKCPSRQGFILGEVMVSPTAQLMGNKRIREYGKGEGWQQDTRLPSLPPLTRLLHIRPAARDYSRISDTRVLDDEILGDSLHSIPRLGQ
jgi:hypothetical protein